MNAWNEDKVAWAGLSGEDRDAIETGPIERLNENDVWEPWAGELEDNGVYRTGYDWKEVMEQRARELIFQKELEVKYGISMKGGVEVAYETAAGIAAENTAKGTGGN